MDFITSLTERSALATKTHKRVNGSWETRNYDKGFHWSVEELAADSLAGLAAVLESLRPMRHTLVIRGKHPNPGQAGQRRLKIPKPDCDVVCSPVPHRWIMLDVDGYTALDQEVDFSTHPAEALALFQSRLPEPWASTACYWQASASAGIKPGIRAHLWYWLDRPLDDTEAKRLATSLKKDYNVDPGVCELVKPHYVADPIFIDAIDHMPQRSGMLPGAAELTVPDDLPTTGQAQAAVKRLEQVCKFLAKVQVGGRNNLVYGAAKDLGRDSPLSDVALKHHLHTAAQASGMELEEAVEVVGKGLRAGRAEREGPAAWRKPLILSDDGKILPIIDNLEEIMGAHPDLAGCLGWHERKQEIHVLRPLPWETPGDFSDNDTHRLRVWFSKELKLQVKPADVWPLAISAATRNSFEPFRDYLASLQWDGTPRLSAMYRLFNVESSGYAERTFRCWLISAVARTFRPGCQADHMLILVGAQGYYKTTGLKALLPPEPGLFRTLTGRAADLQGTDNLVKLLGPAVVCIDEMAALKGKDIETTKSFITEASDCFRPKYGKSAKDFPRRMVFCGTSNSDTFLTDTTGARRFWPHQVTERIDVPAIEAVRDQLWAEAVHAYESGERYYLTPAETLALGVEIHQEKRREISPLEEVITDYLYAAPAFVTKQDLRDHIDQRIAGGSQNYRVINATVAKLRWVEFRPSRTAPRGWKRCDDNG